MIKKIENKEPTILKLYKKYSKYEKGLLLITNPTGSGKSRATSTFSVQQLLKDSSKRLYIVTPRIANVSEIYDDIHRDKPT